jgi:hypothetical protein
MYVVGIYVYFVHDFLVFIIAVIPLPAITFFGVGAMRRYLD